MRLSCFFAKNTSMLATRISLIALLIFVLAGCKKSDAPAPGLAAETRLAVKYGLDPKQAMDIYLPAGRSVATTRAMILIHGGGWTLGDRADLNAFVDTLRRRQPDYAIFNISYRLSAAPDNVFPTQELDVKAALEYIYDRINSEYKISDRWVLLGASAGAHLAMLQGYKYAGPVRPKAIVSFFGPSNLTEMFNNPPGGNPLIAGGLAAAVGATPTQNPTIYTNSSPVTFINNLSPATILLHGGIDPLVSPSQSTQVRDRLVANGRPAQYVFYPSGGHGDWNDATFFDAFNQIQAFLATHNP